MGSTSNAIFAGVGAGLGALSQGLMQQEQQEKEDERIKRSEDLKERELKIREQDAENRAKAAKRQELMDTTTIKHSNLVRDLSLAGDNQELRAQAFSKYHPDKRQYKPNQAARDEIAKRSGREVFAVWDVSYNDTDPVTGEVKVDPTTGKAKQIQSPAGPMIFYTSDEYANWQAKIMNHDLFFAHEAQGLTDQMALDRARKLHEQRAATPLGEAELEVKEATADHKRAQAEKLRADAKAGPVSEKPTGKVTDISGKEVTLTTPEQNRLINDTKSLKEIIPGVTSGEAYRLMEGIKDPKLSAGLTALAQSVVDGKNTEADAVAGIQKKYSVSRTVAKDVLAEQMQGLQDNTPSFFDKLFGKDK